MASHSTLLTEGSIRRKIVTFAIPLFLGNLFQQLYNTADSVIVGNFLGSEALASVSSSGNLIFLLVGFFNGIFVGAGVIIARYFGAGDRENLEKAVHTTVAFGLAGGVTLTVVGYILAPRMLIWMNTPADILEGSTLYFRIYFLGSLPFVLYNACVGILQAVGDSRRPLYYLIVSSIVNILLDLLFVGVFHMGVGSAALATSISHLVSCVLVCWNLLTATGEYRVQIRKIRFHRLHLRQVVTNGLPAGAQNSIISFANVIVQTYINGFGKLAVAGQGAYSRLEGFAFLPITCFSMALTTFISQNLGAGETDRAKKGSRFGILCSLIMAETIGLIFVLFAPDLLSLFDGNPDVIAFGVGRMRICAFFYCLLALSHCMAGVMRGAGRAMVPMVVMLVCWCLIRVTYITLAVPATGSISTLNWAYPITWGLSSVCFLVYYFKVDWIHSHPAVRARKQV